MNVSRFSPPPRAALPLDLRSRGPLPEQFQLNRRFNNPFVTRQVLRLSDSAKVQFTLAREHAQQYRKAFIDAFEAAQAALLIPPIPAGPISRFETVPIPQGVWYLIVARYLAPRGMALIQTEIGLAPCMERITPLFFVDPATEEEILKTHTLAFTGLLQEPVLYNSQSDVVLFNNMDIVQKPTSKPRAFELLRNVGARFIAVDFTSASIYAEEKQRVLNSTGRNTIAAAVRMFGCVEEVFILIRHHHDQPEESSKEEAELWKGVVTTAIDEAFAKALTMWQAVEKLGRTVNRWRKPDIVEVVWDFDELLHEARKRVRRWTAVRSPATLRMERVESRLLHRRAEVVDTRGIQR